ncbi:MAG TPA: serine/threonine-protein kinase [Pirellulales bacterium]|nr:serine/threonine-protein kinase [Pirellulales bacterium]
MSASLASDQAFGSTPLRADWTGALNSIKTSAVENRTAVTAPLRLGPWLLVSRLREGTLTRAYRARPAEAKDDANLAPAYVIKVLREEWHDHPAAVARIRQEATVGRCVAHKHLLPVLAAHIHRPPYYLVLPHLTASSVASTLAVRGQLNVPVALWIARQAAQALGALHTAGYLHGDIKPRNLLLAPNGHVTLLDLTCTRRLDDAAEMSDPTLYGQPLLGTPKYLAPEMFFGRPADERSDLYSLGLTLYEMLAGKLPAMPDHLPDLVEFKRTARLLNLRNSAPQVQEEVAQLVRCLTAQDPLRRPHTARETAERLMRLEIATLRQRIPA